MVTVTQTGLKILQINNQATGAQNLNDEWVCLVNDGSEKWNLATWEITDETATQRVPHIYKLPGRLASGATWSLDPGEALYLFTGVGTDEFVARPSTGRPQFHFFWNRASFVWNNAGDRVYLRHPNGQFGTQPFPIP